MKQSLCCGESTLGSLWFLEPTQSVVDSDTEFTHQAESANIRLKHPVPSERCDTASLPTAAASDSDSGDSLFHTQHDTVPLRTVRRERPKPLLVQRPAHESDRDSEESSSPERLWESLPKLKRRSKTNPEKLKKYNWKGPVFPFLEKFTKSKHLPRRRVLTLEYGAIGGFFKYVKKKKNGSKSQENLASSSLMAKRRFFEDEDLLPLSEPDQAKEFDNREAGDGINVVEPKDFILKFKKRFRGDNPWFQKPSSNTGWDLMKNSRKTSGSLKRKNLRTVLTGSGLRKPSTSYNADDEYYVLGNTDSAAEQEDDGDSFEQAPLSPDSCPQEEDEDRSVSDALEQQGAVKKGKESRKHKMSTLTVRRGTYSAPVICKSRPLGAETVGNSEDIPHGESRQSIDVIQLRKGKKSKTERQASSEPTENDDAGTLNADIPASINEQESHEGMTDTGIPHVASLDLFSVKRKTGKRKGCFQKQTSDVEIHQDSMEQISLPEGRICVSFTKEDMRDDEGAVDIQDHVAEKEEPLTLRDDVYEIRSTAVVSTEDESNHAGESAECGPGQNAQGEPTDRMPRKRLKVLSGHKYEAPTPVGKKHLSLNCKDLTDRRESGRSPDFQNVVLENEGSAELFDSPDEGRRSRNTERFVEEEMAQAICGQNKTHSPAEKPSAETTCGKGGKDTLMGKSSKNDREKLNKMQQKGSKTVLLPKKDVEKPMEVVGLQDSEEEAPPALLTVLPSLSRNDSYDRSKSKKVISETPESGDDPVQDGECDDLGARRRRRRRRRRKKKRGENEEQFCISGSLEYMCAPNSAIDGRMESETHRQKVEVSQEMTLSCLNDVMKKRRKKKKPVSVEHGDGHGGNFSAGLCDCLIGQKDKVEDGVMQNVAADHQPMARVSQQERSMTFVEQKESEHQPKMKKKKGIHCGQSGDGSSEREVVLSAVKPKMPGTGLQLAPDLRSEEPRDRKAGKSGERKRKLVSSYEPAVSKLAGTDIEGRWYGETRAPVKVHLGANAVQECAEVSAGKRRGSSYEGGRCVELRLVKQKQFKIPLSRLFTLRFQSQKFTGSLFYQILLRNYQHSKKGQRKRTSLS